MGFFKRLLRSFSRSKKNKTEVIETSQVINKPVTTEVPSLPSEQHYPPSFFTSPENGGWEIKTHKVISNENIISNVTDTNDILDLTTADVSSTIDIISTPSFPPNPLPKLDTESYFKEEILPADTLESASPPNFAIGPSKQRESRPLNIDLPTHDIAGHFISSHLEDPTQEEIAAIKIQTWWRHLFRSGYIHKQRQLFNLNSTHTQDNKFALLNILQIPLQFRHCVAENKTSLFITTSHFSKNLRKILKDGVIYPQHISKIDAGYCSTKDKGRFDDRLTFTSPIYQFPNDDSITFSFDKLAEANSKSLYFKFYDWAISFSTVSNVTPNIIMRVENDFPETSITFLTHTNDILDKLSIQGEDLIYHGYEGLNNYLTFFIFKILAKSNNIHLKNAIYKHFEELDKDGTLIIHLHSIMRAMLFRCEVDFVNKIKLNLDHIISINEQSYQLNCFQLKKEIEFDDVDYLRKHHVEKFAKFSYFIVKGIIEHAIKHKAKNVEDFMKHEFKDLLTIPYRVKLLERFNYVYENHLSKPFKETHLSSSDAELTKGKHIVYRPNHGLAHTLRVVTYLEPVIEYYKNYASEKLFRDFCSSLTNDQVLDIQTALLFSVSGRESELSFSEAPEIYNGYREASAQQFEKFAHSRNYSTEKIKLYRDLIRFMGNPLFLNMASTDEQKFIYYLMNLSHKLDLMRCYSAERYMKSIDAAISSTVRPSIYQGHNLNKLLHFVTASLDATGDRLYCAFRLPKNRSYCDYGQGFIVDTNIDYDRRTFVKASKSPAYCMTLMQDPLSDVNTKLMIVPSFSKEEQTDSEQIQSHTISTLTS